MKYILIVLVLISGVKLFSQDQLFKKDNSKYDVKVLEVTPDEVKYKLKDNPNGPLYTVRKNDVALIIYENGTHETYPDAKPQSKAVYVESRPYYMIDSLPIKKAIEREKQYISFTRFKNVAFINVLDLANSCIGVSYFREFGNGIFDVDVPLSFSFAKPAFLTFFGPYNPGSYSQVNNFQITQKVYDVGLGLYINTSGRRAITHFIGPLIRFAQYNGTFQSYDYYNYYYYPLNLTTHGFVVNETTCMINNGVLFRLKPHFSFKINAAVGFLVDRTFVANDPANFQNPNYGYNYTTTYQYSPTFQMGFHFGYRF